MITMPRNKIELLMETSKETMRCLEVSKNIIAQTMKLADNSCSCILAICLQLMKKGDSETIDFIKTKFDPDEYSEELMKSRSEVDFIIKTLESLKDKINKVTDVK